MRLHLYGVVRCGFAEADFQERLSFAWLLRSSGFKRAQPDYLFR